MQDETGGTGRIARQAGVSTDLLVGCKEKVRRVEAKLTHCQARVMQCLAGAESIAQTWIEQQDLIAQLSKEDEVPLSPSQFNEGLIRQLFVSANGRSSMPREITIAFQPLLLEA